ncbi:putative transposon-derived Buster3 transposase-like protein-like [Apostichopus japonicus]|uniref:Putative transposon-derived Buster3 transposase-like protein-like n=1 Tax=Stichopus japonicus TaxID=307972 RepID=A0A2G8L7S0_STIJA|nr:putative transposon-derived Buster3 transposase-like protein-like [Apostichopus japonicus]
MNVLNRTLQGKDTNLMIANDNIKGFLATLALLKSKVDNRRFHIQSLISQFDKYFPELDVPSFAVARDPFTAPLDAVAEDDIIEEELVRMKQDSEAKTVYQSFSLQEFWCRMLKSYPNVSQKAVWLLMPYPTSYICEQSFSTMAAIKTKSRIDCQ